MPGLAQRYRVHYYDLIGYGQSEKRNGQNVSLGVQNRLLTELLDHWDLDKPRVVAHDFGGATTLRTYLLDNRDFGKMVLINVVAIAPWGSPFLVRRERRLLAYCVEKVGFQRGQKIVAP